MKLVITERGTIEGYTAAWVAKRMLKNECEIAQMGTGDRLPQNTEKKDILIFGVSFNRNLVFKLAKDAAATHTEFRLFENDFKAKQELTGIKEVKINLNQTAARMAWEFLRADFKVKIGKEKKQEFHLATAPWIVDYSDNPKLWKWKELNPHFIKFAIESCYLQELEDWDELATRDLAIVIEQGKEATKNLQQKQSQTKEEEKPDGQNDTPAEASSGATGTSAKGHRNNKNHGRQSV